MIGLAVQFADQLVNSMILKMRVAFFTKQIYIMKPITTKKRTISLKRSDGPKIQIEIKDKEDFVDGNNIMRLYNIAIPAYTFSYEDLIVEMIDNSSYTMRDIARLQTRIENLEDIAQLNSLELQAIQSKFMGSDGGPNIRKWLVGGYVLWIFCILC